MNYVTTNIRLSEDEYLRLKNEAAKKRKSLSAIIRAKLRDDDATQPEGTILKMMKDLDTLANKNSKKLEDFDSLSVLRQMRDEAKW